jgi:hypothetical protein
MINFKLWAYYEANSMKQQLVPYRSSHKLESWPIWKIICSWNNWILGCSIKWGKLNGIHYCFIFYFFYFLYFYCLNIQELRPFQCSFLPCINWTINYVEDLNITFFVGLRNEYIFGLPTLWYWKNCVPCFELSGPKLQFARILVNNVF